MRLRRRSEAADPRVALAQIIGEAELPVFPGTVTEALDRIGDPDAGLDAVAEVIELDPGLSVNVLRTVNAAAFAPRTRIGSVDQATRMLGKNQLESILIAFAVRHALPSSSAPGFESSRFWATAARRAGLAAALAEVIDPSRRSESFTAALLQDMAVPLLVHRRDDYGPVLESWQSSDADLADIERQRFGWDHAEVAGMMSTSWAFPDQLSDAVKDHHDLGGDGDTLVAAKLVGGIREVDPDGTGEAAVRERITGATGLVDARLDAVFEAGEANAASMAGLLA